MNTTTNIATVRPGMIVRLGDGQVVGVVAKVFDSGVYGLTGVDGEVAWVHNTRSVEVVDMAALKSYRREVARKAEGKRAELRAVIEAGTAECISILEEVL